MAKDRTKFTIAVRAAIAVLYILLALCMFVTGRTHTVLIDNHGAEDGSYKAIKNMTVTVNRNAPSEFMKGDLDKFTVRGQKLVIRAFLSATAYSKITKIISSSRHHPRRSSFAQEVHFSSAHGFSAFVQHYFPFQLLSENQDDLQINPKRGH